MSNPTNTLAAFTAWAKARITSLKRIALFICATAFLPLAAAADPALAADIPRRLIAIDNVCAWPNLVKLKDGSSRRRRFQSAQPRPDGGRCGLLGQCGRHFSGTSSARSRGMSRRRVRMNHAAGLNAAGDLVVLCNGWDKVAPQRNAASRPIQTVVCLSHDGGKTWEQGGPVLPKEEGLCWQVPFGDIMPGGQWRSRGRHLRLRKGRGKYLRRAQQGWRQDLARHRAHRQRQPLRGRHPSSRRRQMAGGEPALWHSGSGCLRLR